MRTLLKEYLFCFFMTEFEKKLYAGPFNAIKSGKKTFEIRANKDNSGSSGSINDMLVGDKIIFTNTATGERLSCIIHSKQLFDSAELLLTELGLSKTVSHSVTSITEGVNCIYAIPNYESLILKNGIFAIGLRDVKVL